MANKPKQTDEPVVHDASDPDKPWERQFDDDRDENGNFSRVANRKKHRGNTALYWGITAVLLLLILVPIAVTVLGRNADKGGPDYTNDKIVIDSSRKSAKKVTKQASTAKSSQVTTESNSDKAQSADTTNSTAPADQSQADSQEAASSAEKAEADKQAQEQAAAASSKAAADAQAKAASESRAKAESEAQASSSSDAGATGTYTVKAGDNLFRIAVNHGMSLSEFLQLNGLSQGASIAPGQVLKVK